MHTLPIHMQLLLLAAAGGLTLIAQAADPVVPEPSFDLEFSANQSGDYGFIGSAEATGVLGDNFPLYSRLQLGPDYRDLLVRAGVTLFGQQGLLVFTGRGLQTRREYDFGLTKAEAWTRESSFGIDFSGKFFGMTMGSYAGVSDTPAKDLGSERLTLETPDSYLDYLVPRKLTGSRDYSGGVLLSSVINPSVRTGMSLGAQRIETELASGTQTKTGMTGSFALDVMLGQGMQVNAFGSAGPDSYDGGLRFYFPVEKQFSLFAQCNGQHQKGNGSNLLCGAGVQYRFGAERIATEFQVGTEDRFTNSELKQQIRWLPDYVNHVATSSQVDSSAPPVLQQVRPKATGTPPSVSAPPAQYYYSGTPFAYDLSSWVSTTDGDPILSYTLTGGLPSGISFNPATGMLSGVATDNRDFTLQFTATDKDGTSVPVTFLLYSGA